MLFETEILIETRRKQIHAIC